ncbi:hypothetical protein Pst134EA_019127 [Puccinia striiformis f. sp. tritici]|uniref:Thioredoxin domain-containing protein n=2 Tax=Puccinia striiformis f. sp. tritici TaxID=168172 RepID=A0A0L0W2D8_9BASI|nr:hypothetical protein Pst134EA_019127 [Puccinia striiformis f. sp. tritici]KAH9458973.1 hypothetical protein Pst134EA_019127 [Puccinia striiformis f. sp. tritici]KNF05666.1 hypothetical protein PSTG_01067 [Puccinia striiformis f. sp. tritici PST-78]
MKSFGIIATLLALASSIHADAAVRPKTAAPASDIIELTLENFDTVVATTPLILVEFMVPWCHFCQDLGPEYKRSAKILKEQGIPSAKVDCTEQDELCAEHLLPSYPTLKVFSNGRMAVYKGPKKADSIVSYIENKEYLGSNKARISSRRDSNTV